MARRPSELEELRELIRKTQQNTNRKVKRLEARGVKISGTQFDIRREISRIRSYNKAQLNAYLSELLGFNSRENAFVVGKKGAPIRKSIWREYEQLEKQVNRQVDIHEQSIGGIMIEPGGTTIKERLAMMKDLSRFNTDSPRAMRRYDRRPEYMKNERAVMNAIKGLEKRADREKFITNKATQARKNFRKMLKESGAGDLAKMLNKLNPTQLDILFGYTSGADTISRLYNSFKDSEGTAKEIRNDKWVEDHREEIFNMLEWVSTVKTSSLTPKGVSGRRK